MQLLLQKERGEQNDSGWQIFSTNDSGNKTTTLYVTDEFPQYYSDKSAGRGCEGSRTESIYVGTYDTSAIKLGATIEIFYDKAISTAKGTFQTVKKIDVLK